MPKLRYLGHSAWEVVEGEHQILIDPFLTGNPLAAVAAEDLNPTAIILTHGHSDHVGDTLSIAGRTGATVVSNFEISMWCQQRGASVHPMHIGGAHQFDWGWVKLTPAWHGSTYIDDDGVFHTLGMPTGVLLRVGGRTLYHAGDTGLFGDMGLIGRHGIDVALLPIGDNFTMGPDDAIEAVKLLQPQVAMPMHYDTFPVIQQDARGWAARVSAETSARGLFLEPGQAWEF